MPSYGVTDEGFVLKRMDEIMEEVHGELTEGFGFDTRLSESSFLNVLVTSFCGQIADLWEAAQDEYYAKFPSTATGINLDNAVQFGGVRRLPNSRSMYPLHCTGDDGTVDEAGSTVATDTSPEVRLYSANDFTIERANCNAIEVVVAVAQKDVVYTVTINGDNYSFSSTDAEEDNILQGLKDAITDSSYDVTLGEDVLVIKDTNPGRNNVIALTDNLSTSSVTVIANFYTEEYGKITLPNGLVTKMVDNVSGFTSVTNILEPIYGRLQETDIELRQSYIARSALRSNAMIDSIVSELLENVTGVETASAYENDTDVTNERGLPPHSIEVVVDGGGDYAIAEAILRKKAGGIQTYGNVVVNVDGKYGDVIPIKFNRPEYVYAWIKVVLHGDASAIPVTYAKLTTDSIVDDTKSMFSGSALLTQLLNEGIYESVAGITYVDIYTAYSTDKAYVPKDGDYKQSNIVPTMRQKVLVDASRIGVSLYGIS